MKHPNSERSKDEFIALAEIYLPPDGTDWMPICKGVISWLEDRANENLFGCGEWFAWRYCDPVHIATDAVCKKGREYYAGTQKGWCDLLFTLHRRRMEHYNAMKKAERPGGAE